METLEILRDHLGFILGVLFAVVFVTVVLYCRRKKICSDTSDGSELIIKLESEINPELKNEPTPQPEPTPEANFHSWWWKKVGLSTDLAKIEAALSELTKEQCVGARLYLSDQVRACESYRGGDMCYQNSCENASAAYSEQLSILKAYCMKFTEIR